METVAEWIGEISPMRRPCILVKTARHCARRYRRQRDLPGAVPGLLAQPEDAILPRLARAEARCEQERRTRAAGYRPSRHVQILAALLAETLRAQPNASGSDALRSAI